MSDAKKPDYTECNPALMLGSVDPNEDLPEQRIHLKIYNEDGTPNYFENPTSEACEDFTEKFINITNGMDAREVLFHLRGLHDVIMQATQGGLALAHMQAHDPSQADDGFDEDILCHGVKQYAEAPPEGVHAANVGEHVLKNFFPDKDTKPH